MVSKICTFWPLLRFHQGFFIFSLMQPVCPDILNFAYFDACCFTSNCFIMNSDVPQMSRWLPSNRRGLPTNHRRFIQAWPAPFQALVSEWWHTAPSARHKRTFIRTLLPIPLYNHVFSRMGLAKQILKSQTGAALPARREKTTTAVKKAKDWLLDNPSSFPLPPAVSLNLWNM